MPHSETPSKSVSRSFLCVLGFVCGCTVGPKYKTPTTPLTPAFKEPPPDNWKTATPHDDTLRGNWWEIFGESQTISSCEVSTSRNDYSTRPFPDSRRLCNSRRIDSIGESPRRLMSNKPG